MTERERLIELLKKSGDKLGEYIMENDTIDHTPTTDELCGVRADYLLAKGVIVAPMPMADWLRQELTEYVHKRCVEEL